MRRAAVTGHRRFTTSHHLAHPRLSDSLCYLISYNTFSYDDDAHGPPSFAAASPEKKAKLTSSSA
jgi:hypothetical protein